MNRYRKAPRTHYDPGGWQVRRKRGGESSYLWRAGQGFKGWFVTESPCLAGSRRQPVAFGSPLNSLFRLFFPVHADARRRALDSLAQLFPRPAQDRADAVHRNGQFRADFLIRTAFDVVETADGAL